jgi:spore coat protein H
MLSLRGGRLWFRLPVGLRFPVLGGLVILPALIVLSACAALPAQSQPRPLKAGDVFQLTNVHAVCLTITPEQWAAMEPKGGGGLFGGPGGPGRPGGPGAFGPGMFIAPAFLRAGDKDGDGKLSAAEFQALGEEWFAAWDREKKGTLNTDQVREGLNASLSPPAMSLQGPEGKRNGVAAMMGLEFPYVHADLEFDGELLKDVAVRYKGNGTFLESRGSLKRSLKVDVGQFAKGRKFAGMAQLNFHNNVTDASWMNEVLSHRLFRDAGVPAPRTAYARVFVTVPGKFDRHYFGLYSMVEDVGAHFAKERFGKKKGVIFKPVTPNMFTDLGDDWKSYRQTYDPKSDLSAADQQRLIEFCRLVTRASDTEFAARLGDFVEIDELARYLAVLVWLVDLDGILGPGQNLYLHLHPETRKLQFIPWDMDHSFGQFAVRGTQEQREQLSIERPWQGENRFLERLFKVEAFKKPYLARLGEINRSLATPQRLAAQVDEIASAIRTAVAEESREKLDRFDRVVAGQSPVAPGLGGLQGFGGPPGFGMPPKPIKPFAQIRAQSVGDQLAGISAGLQLGEFGFGGGPAPGGPAGPRGFGPGNFLAGFFVSAFDMDKNQALTHEEFSQGFAGWFKKWNMDASGPLTEEQLRAGIDRDLTPVRGGPSGGPGFGLPPGTPGGE